MANSNGPGSSSQRGRSARGRTTPKGSPARTAALGRYVDAEQSGRYTRAIPKDTKVSPRWYGPLILALMLLGVLVILLNYLSVFGTPTGWVLLAGLVIIAAGFVLATRYR
ncbi:MAG: cell division protein CrgA [Actinomycetes bacterium]|jgi:hypothetical protein